MTTQKMRILTGHAGHISLSLVAKCGGVVVKSKKMPQVASFPSMKRKGKTRKMTILKIKKKTSFVK